MSNSDWDKRPFDLSGRRMGDPDYGEQPFDLYGQSWKQWNVIPGTPASGAGRDGYKPGTPSINPIDDYDFSKDERKAFESLRRWGEGPVLAAAEELGIDGVDDLEQMNLITDWLKENYGDLFGEGDDDDDEKETIKIKPFERKELDLGDYSLPEEMKIRKSGINVEQSPMKINKTPVTGMNYGTRYK